MLHSSDTKREDNPYDEEDPEESKSWLEAWRESQKHDREGQDDETHWSHRNVRSTINEFTGSVADD